MTINQFTKFKRATISLASYTTRSLRPLAVQQWHKGGILRVSHIRNDANKKEKQEQTETLLQKKSMDKDQNSMQFREEWALYEQEFLENCFFPGLQCLGNRFSQKRMFTNYATFQVKRMKMSEYVFRNRKYFADLTRAFCSFFHF